ncbi:hypothetical protein OW495_05355 [Vibrio sp. 14N.309.X.WAT.E.F5]|uniref:hypothetical protein n=1 Tax=Vibrio sp. 14N.309.X.WAT.E.F5 TaxID=2998321 RepID=UPI0025AF37B5|nr:hypothetical protein [Vibrio sp. 14N.309.X.WAT.E.F5]MDN2666134.1 hypothetical protein [Vibrio sp. 14N.309.X.WAT.E.F5]
MSSTFSEYKELLPIATFILGYVLNGVIEAVKKRSNLNKIRKILDHEVSRNVEILAIGVSKIPKDLSEELYLFNFAKVVARISEAMTSTVFDAYIAELSKLNSNEIEGYLSFYSTIGQLKLHSNELIKFLQIEGRNEKQSEQMIARVQAVSVVAKALLNKTNV